MIHLFHIPQYQIDTSKFSNLLHDKIVREFEERFAEYVGAKYAVSFNSATSAIYLIFSEESGSEVTIPSIIPPVVPNALMNANCYVTFEDNIKWVGDSYILHQWADMKLIDSAQKVERDQFKKEANDNDLMVFSFYPTKPIGSCDGGMVVSNDKEAIEKLRTLSFNGTSQEANNWERKQTVIGHKMYMNSIQAYIANENLKVLGDKKEKISVVRDYYNAYFMLNNTSDHLYRINVTDRIKFIQKAKDAGIICGHHYPAAHLNKLFYGSPNSFTKEEQELPLSVKEAETTVSIPLHENLTRTEMQTIIQFVHDNR